MPSLLLAAAVSGLAGAEWIARGSAGRREGWLRCAEVHDLVPEHLDLLFVCVALRLEQAHAALDMVTGIVNI